jgi:predicted ribosome quality control (RQC) complex YloA/Tae2 family protein
MQEQPPNKSTEKVKTKVRFTSLDIAAVVAELQDLIGMRVSNIYDVSPTTYLFKLTKSEQKSHLLVENGVRFHLT